MLKKRNSIIEREAHFDLIAPYYLAMELLLAGNVMQRCRTFWLPQIQSARQILLLGEGRGRFLEELLKSNRTANITCIDNSSTMIELMRRRLENLKLDTARVQFICADIRKWKPKNEFYDLIVSHFFLDCFSREELEQLVPQIAQGLIAKGKWLISDFREPARGFKRMRAQIILWLMYFFFRGITNLNAHRLIDPSSSLQKAGLQLEAKWLFNLEFLYSEIWQSSNN